MEKTGKRLHVIPLGDFADHEASIACWCQPWDNSEGIVMHNAKDCREQMERAEKPTGKLWCRISETYSLQPGYALGSDADPLALLRRIATPKAFMDLEGVRIICADFMAKWDVHNSQPNDNCPPAGATEKPI